MEVRALTGGRRWARRLSTLPWWGSALVGSVLVVLLSLPQFLRVVSGGGPAHYPWYVLTDGTVLPGLILDQTQYLGLTEALAGANGSFGVAPFTSRALGPLLASWLPLGAPPALMAVNLASLVLGTFALAALAWDLTRRRSAVLVTVVVWAVSFPVFWYTGKLLVDAAAVGLVPVVLWAAHRRRLLLGCAVLFAAVWTKEATVLVVVAMVAFEWMRRDVSAPTRAARSAVWVVTAVVAFVSTGLIAAQPGITFAPWIPDPLAARTALWNNTAYLSALGQCLLAAGPALIAFALWLPRLKVDGRDDELGGVAGRREVVVPLLIGSVVPLGLTVWSLWSAMFDGRSAWMSLPFASVLLGLWWADVPRPAREARVRHLVRSLGVPLVVLVVVWVALGSLLGSLWSPALVEPVDVAPRFAAAPLDDVEPGWDRTSGVGSAEIRLVGDGPSVVRFDSTAPATIVSGDLSLPHSPAPAGTVLVEHDGPTAAVIETDGRWTVDVGGPEAAMPWEVLSPLEGTGPATLLLPSGLTRPKRVEIRFDDPQGRVLLAGRCALGQCPAPSESGVMPAGAEAVVIDAVGKWELVPDPFAEIEDPPDPI